MLKEKSEGKQKNENNDSTINVCKQIIFLSKLRTLLFEIKRNTNSFFLIFLQITKTKFMQNMED